ncbi:hypothetical protein [Chitinophaga caseinilytica]|uniref:hypothetical protein n=1 Tax=Chitinophaga caseinilytica TaxID=2267521 RepID=UPI003C2C24AD
MTVNLISGNDFQDARGKLTFVNDFDMSAVRRFYTIEHPDTAVVRAWQGHRVERKWFHVLEGAFEISVVKPDDWSQPSGELPVTTFKLEAGNPQVLAVPSGNATGFRATVANSKMIVFSDQSLDDSKQDDFRFPGHLWRNWS